MDTCGVGRFVELDGLTCVAACSSKVRNATHCLVSLNPMAKFYKDGETSVVVDACSAPFLYLEGQQCVK